jgi:phosphoribosylglycinamide formyltransferase-1
MYGDHVHKAVLANKEEEHGITIHFANEHFDEGEIIYQARFKVDPNDTLDIIKFKGQQLEHQYFPKIIENLIKKM